MDILNIIALIVCMIISALISWYYGYMAGYHKATKKQMQLMNRHVVELKSNIGKPFLNTFTEIIDNLTNEAYCYRCGAPIPNHYHGCPYAAQWQSVTIAKP